MMKTIKTLAAALVVAGISASAGAVELGEFKGATFSMGGFLKAEGIWGNPDNGKNTFDATARESRINFKATREVEGHKLTGFIEGDLWNNQNYDDSAELRLRHAFVRINNLTVGQTWSGQFFATAPFDARMINFFGPGWGTIGGNGGTIRPSMVAHYVLDNGLRLTAQEPIYDNASLPDMVVSYSKRYKSGSAYNVAVTVREVEQLNYDSEIGAALSLMGRFAVAKGALFAGAYTGKGVGVYSGACNAGLWAPNSAPAPANPVKSHLCDINAATGALVAQSGFNLGVTQNLTPKLNATLRYGKVMVDNAADLSAYMTTATLIYNYLPSVDFGIEWRDQDNRNHPLRPAGQQVEVMAKYYF